MGPEATALRRGIVLSGPYQPNRPVLLEQATRQIEQLPVGGTQPDLALLRAFEPIVRYTRGELFRPMAVEAYVARCSLWRSEPRRDATCIVPAGRLSIDRLTRESLAHQDAPLSLRYVQEPLGRAEYRRWRRAPRERLQATGRFTTTGLFGRLVEAGFRASLLLRGKVSAGLAAAAEISYSQHGEPDRAVYYGHVVRDGGYACLQYWFFYAMNDWRSTFSGVNDHEADWELITVYLAEREDGSWRPAWVAFSSHDEAGDDLRRRWDDPDLQHEGDHPIVYAGAGSHSGAFVAGDYVISVDPPQLRRPIAFARRIQHLLAPWRDETRAGGGFGIPFVDYARGDGESIGPGQGREWAPTAIDDDTAWVRAFRGLWGLDTRDPFGGERAPAGPRYERNGSVRVAWANPLGWAGLLKVPSRRADSARLLAERAESLQRQVGELDETIAAERAALRSLQVQVRSLDAHHYARALANSRRSELADREAKLNQLIAERTRLADERRSHLDSLEHPPADLPDAHIASRHEPRTEQEERQLRFLRLWSVLSTPLLLASPIVVLIAQPLTWITTIAALVALFLGAEAIARHRFLSFLASLLLMVAVVGGIVGFALLIHNYWRVAVSAVLGAAALALLIGNLNDLRHGWLRGAAPHDDEQR